VLRGRPGSKSAEQAPPPRAASFGRQRPRLVDERSVRLALACHPLPQQHVRRPRALGVEAPLLGLGPPPLDVGVRLLQPAA
jgi:hypothetical protein